VHKEKGGGAKVDFLRGKEVPTSFAEVHGGPALCKVIQMGREGKPLIHLSMDKAKLWGGKDPSPSYCEKGTTGG